MQQQDLQQIKQILKEEFKENNKKLCKKMDDKIDKLEDNTMRTIKEKFDQNSEQHDKINKRLDKINKKLSKKPNKDHMFDWADKKIHNLELDMDNVKYIHRHEWKKLPAAYEIKKELVKNGMA